MAENTAVSQDHALSDLGSEIRQLRKVRGITLQQLALATGKSVGFLSQVERSLTKPSVAALQDISEALSVHIGWFFPEDACMTRCCRPI
jgi:transcriptional regulator with XRE-family HTH domain